MNSGCSGFQVCTHISLAAAWAASRPARPAACISRLNSRSGARKSCPLVTICVPTSTSTSPACTCASCSSSAPLARVLSASMRAMRTGVPSGRAVAAVTDDAAEPQRVLKLLLAELPVKTAVKLAAEITGAPRNDLYQAALEMKG